MPKAASAPRWLFTGALARRLAASLGERRHMIRVPASLPPRMPPPARLSGPALLRIVAQPVNDSRSRPGGRFGVEKLGVDWNVGTGDARDNCCCWAAVGNTALSTRISRGSPGGGLT